MGLTGGSACLMGPLQKGRFLRGGDGSFQVFWQTGWKSFWNEHQLVAWSCQPSIFTQNDCLNTVFSDVVSLRGSCRNKQPSDNPHWKNFNLSCSFLSACKKSFLTRKEIFMQVDRSIKQKHICIFTCLGLLEGL